MARVNRAIAMLGAVVVIGGSLSGCGGKVITAEDTTILISEFAENGMDAMGGGRLEVVGGCLGANPYVVGGVTVPPACAEHELLLAL